MTVSLAHFMRNLAVDVSCQLYRERFGTDLTSFILNYFNFCSEGVGIQTGLRVVWKLDHVLPKLSGFGINVIKVVRLT